MTDPLRDSRKYAKIKDLNSGTSGFVQLAFNLETGEQVAIKFIERGPHIQRTVARELLNHRLCALHPHIIQLKEVFLTPHHLAIAMEYAAGGDLSDVVQRCRLPGMGISEDDSRWLFQQLIIAVDYCHKLGIANRDIKLDNVLLDGCTALPIIKLCDFGYSKDEDSGSVCKTACGTPEYMAPEVLNSNVYDGKAADIWSCGVMLYVMLTATFPFRRPKDAAVHGVKRMQLMFERILNEEFLPISYVSWECRDLLRKMLTADPVKRISIAEIQQHPWFLQDLPVGTLDVNSQLQRTDTARFGPCKQSVEDIMALVNACSEEDAAVHQGRLSDMHQRAHPPGRARQDAQDDGAQGGAALRDNLSGSGSAQTTYSADPLFSA